MTSTTKTTSLRTLSFALGLLATTALTACEDPVQRVNAHMQRGVELYDAQNYDQARLEFRNALQIRPTEGAAYYYLGRIFEAQELVPDAARAYASAVAQTPDHPDANVRLGRYMFLGGQLDDALARAEHVVALSDGKNAEALALRSSVHAAKGNLEFAEADARQALALDPASVNGAAALAGVHQRNNDLPGAVAVLAESLTHNPRDVGLHLAKLAFHLNLAERPEAEAMSLRLIELEPANVWHRIRLGRLYVDWRRLDDAEALLKAGAEANGAINEAKLAYVDFLLNQRGFERAESALRGFVAAKPADMPLRFSLAELYNRNERTPAAMTVLRDIIAAGRGTPAALGAQAGLASLLYAQGQGGEATRMVDEVLRAEPENAAALILRARMQIANAQLVEATDSLRTVLRNAPDSVPALNLLTTAYMRNNQWQLAADTLRKLMEADPRNIVARVELAQLLATHGQTDSALKVLTDAARVAPDSAVVLATRADILIGLGRHAEARAAAGPIMEMPDGRALYLTLMGRIAAAQGNHDEAIAAFQFARQADPDVWQPLNGLVRSMASKGQFDQAANVLNEVLLQNPGDLNARIRLGDLHSAAGDHAAALATYQEVITRQPTNLVAYTRLVGMHYMMGAEEKALDSLRAAVAANPTDASMATALALGLERAGQYKEAIAVYERLRSAGSRNLLVINNLGALIADHDYADPARVTQAIKMMEPLQTTDNAAVIDTIGWLHLRAGRTAEALSFLKRAVALAPANDLLKRHLGEAYQRAGDTENARRYLVETP